MSLFRRIPWWVWSIALVLAAAQPLLLIWIRYATPQGWVPTGLHIPDSALFLYSMRMFENGFASAYATCQSPAGLHSVAFYSVPHLWLYGALGAVARFLHADAFIAYGVANGLGALLYLLAAYAFLREAAPKQARLGFALFALSGGLGGVLYVVTRIMGVQQVPGFAEVFRRFAIYELFEGPHLLPVLLFPRFYYTLSLALCFAALTAFINGVRTNDAHGILRTTLFLPLGVFIDMRFGVFTMGIAFLFLMSQSGMPSADRLRYAAAFAVRFMAGALPALMLMRVNPMVVANHVQVANMAMWFSPFVAVALFHLLLLPGELRARMPGLPLYARLIAGTALGYLGAFTFLFLAYQTYYGNLLVARDAAVANAVSDWALLGGLVGALYVLAHPEPLRVAGAFDWIPLWFLLYLVIALSAFGQGRGLWFGPQRIEAFLWLPLCVLSASALQRLHAAEPRATRILGGIMIACGVCSICVSTLCFQGPLGRRPGAALYPEVHSEVMTQADAHVMDRLGAGIVLAPIPAGDVVVQRRGNRAVFGTGSFNLSDQPYPMLRAGVERFFAKGATEEFRQEFVEDWCVEYVYCPDTWPVEPGAIEELRKLSWLEEIASEGKAVAFRVVGSHEVLASSSG